MCVLEIMYLWSLASLLDHLERGKPSLPTFVVGKCKTDNLASALNSQEKRAFALELLGPTKKNSSHLLSSEVIQQEHSPFRPL